MLLGCINVPTPNAAGLADFYHKVLGANVDDTHGGPDRIEIWFGNGEKHSVTIVASQDTEYKKAETTACQGFEFSVCNVNSEYERICALGVEINEPPRNLPWGYRFFTFKDPDGNSIDIVQKL